MVQSPPAPRRLDKGACGIRFQSCRAAPDTIGNRMPQLKQSGSRAMARRTRTLFTDNPRTEELIRPIRDIAQPLRTPDDLGPLIARIVDARYVLLGEASHGTAEFYDWRSALSRRLIREKG